MAKVYFPSPSDSHRVSEIYITSMAHNAVLLLQYPTEEQQREVQEYAATQFQSFLKEHPKNVVVVRENDEDHGDIMSFLKYEIHQDVETEAPSKPADIPDHGDWYQRYLQITNAARTKNMHQPHIRWFSFCLYHCTRANYLALQDLSLLCTAPRYQGRGAARALINYLKKVAVEKKLPIYIESTMNAVPLYGKLGWKHVDWIRMMIPKKPNGPLEEEYQERCMLWEAKEQQSGVSD